MGLLLLHRFPTPALSGSGSKGRLLQAELSESHIDSPRSGFFAKLQEVLFFVNKIQLAFNRERFNYTIAF